jgi:hypothetical protein
MIESIYFIQYKYHSTLFHSTSTTFQFDFIVFDCIQFNYVHSLLMTVVVICYNLCHSFESFYFLGQATFHSLQLHDFIWFHCFQSNENYSKLAFQFIYSFIRSYIHSSIQSMRSSCLLKLLFISFHQFATLVWWWLNIHSFIHCKLKSF